MRIVCVDDEVLVLELVTSLCREFPEKPETVGFSDTEEALIYFKRHRADVALLDINMPTMDGLALAAKIKELRPDTAIIFLTGYNEYAVDAFRMHASGYLLKPVSKERLFDEIRYALSQKETAEASAHIEVRTFGEFDLLVDGERVLFARSRAKELLALMVDRQGSPLTRSQVFAILWEDGIYDRSMQKQLDVVIRSLRATLEEYGISEIFELQRGSMWIHPELFDCDLYRFFQGDIDAVNSYRGEYMTSYPWASLTEAYMDRFLRKE